MALRLAIVIAALTVVSYEHAFRSATRQSVDALANYMTTRGGREQWLFDLASDNLAAVGVQVARRTREYGEIDPNDAFDRRFGPSPGGSLRTRAEGFDANRDAGGVARQPELLDTDAKRRVLAAMETAEEMGRALHTRFQNTWMILPENLSVGFWPEMPAWPFTPVDRDFVSNPLYLLAGPEKNPERKAVWTDVYRDVVGKTSMVSVTRPMYDGDRFLGIVGHDVTLAELFHRTVNVKVEGTYNLIVDRDGDLIAHSALMDRIIAAEKPLKVGDAGEPELEAIFRAALTITGDAGVTEDDRGHAYLGVARLAGPDWLFVTVYPKSLVRREAYQSARFVLLGGLASLLLEVGLLFLVLRSQIAAPLSAMLAATRRVAEGDMNTTLSTRRRDELGQLSSSFNLMTRAVRDREEKMRRAEETLRQSEERFRLLFERSADALLLLDGEVIIDCNDAAVRLFGRSGASELTSRKLADISPDAQPGGQPSAARVSELIAAAFAEGSRRFEWYVKRADGQELPIEIVITSIPFPSGPVLFAVVRDITERKQAEAAIQALNAELADNLEREREKSRTLERLYKAVDVLSAPVLEVSDKIIVLPVIGAIDDRRSAVMVTKLLEAVARMRSRVVIIDVTGVEKMDRTTAERLLAMVGAAEMLGAECILTGIQPSVAQALVSLDVNFGALTTLRTLKNGLRVGMSRIGRASAPRQADKKRS